MFHGKHSREGGLVVARRAAEWAGISLSPEQEAVLAVFAGWLETEAIRAGGLGQAETDRIWPRHVADSLTFAVGWRHAPPPGALLDVGAGVGLPGIPLAITHPNTAVTLLDRSERRIGLARRAIRLLGLENVDTRQVEAGQHQTTYAAVTMRAVIPLPAALSVVGGFLSPGGVGVLAASRRRAPTVEAEAATVIEIPRWVLDSPAWLLRMTSPI
jgi:16S rRNA (guanine527-N7)-methyltransferase